MATANLLTSLDVTFTNSTVKWAESVAALWLETKYYDDQGVVQTLPNAKISDGPIARGAAMQAKVDLSTVRAVAIRSFALTITGATTDGMIPASVNVVAHLTESPDPVIVVDATKTNFGGGGGRWPNRGDADWLDGDTAGAVTTRVFFDDPTTAPSSTTIEVTGSSAGGAYAEWVQLRNIGTQTVDLHGAQLRVPSAQKKVVELGKNVFTFPANTLLTPGTSVKVVSLARAETQTLSFGSELPLFYGKQDIVELHATDGTLLVSANINE